MTKITTEQVMILVDNKCLTVNRVTRASDFVDPIAVKDGTWKEKSKTTVHATLCGQEITAKFDPNHIGSRRAPLESFLAKVLAKKDLGPVLTEEDLICEALAETITAEMPYLSNHARLRILDVLDLTEGQTE